MNFLRKLFVVGLTVGTFSSLASADDFKNNFQTNLNQKSIDNLTKDIGSLVAGGSFHTGKALGFPVGFDVGAHATSLAVQDDDAILRDDSSHASAVAAQVEVGLPVSLNLVARGGKIEDATFYGGGLRWGILSPSVPLMPSLSVTGLYNTIEHDYFKADVVSANLVLSVDVPFVRPYIGGGYDWTSLDVKSQAYVGAPGTATPSLDSSEGGYRAEAGVNISVIPFTYLTLAGGLTNGKTLYHLGLGVTF